MRNHLQCHGSVGAICAILSLTACGIISKQPSISDAPIFEKGFQIFPSPRTFDAPGTVFRIDQGGVRRAIVDLSPMVPVTPQPEAIPSIFVRGAFDTGIFLSWIGHRGEAAGYQHADSALVAVQGAKRERVFEVDLMKVVDSAARVVDWTKPGSVYLITETVEADSVDIDLTSSVAATIGDTLKADSARARGIAVSWRPKRSTHLALRFPRPYRVFYKVDQLIRRSGLENDSLPPVIRLPIVGALSWREP